MNKSIPQIGEKVIGHRHFGVKLERRESRDKCRSIKKIKEKTTTKINAEKKTMQQTNRFVNEFFFC